MRKPQTLKGVRGFETLNRRPRPCSRAADRGASPRAAVYSHVNAVHVNASRRVGVGRGAAGARRAKAWLCPRAPLHLEQKTGRYLHVPSLFSFTRACNAGNELRLFSSNGPSDVCVMAAENYEAGSRNAKHYAAACITGKFANRCLDIACWPAYLKHKCWHGSSQPTQPHGGEGAAVGSYKRSTARCRRSKRNNSVRRLRLQSCTRPREVVTEEAP